jgi:hypothetical protein
MLRAREGEFLLAGMARNTASGLPTEGFSLFRNMQHLGKPRHVFRPSRPLIKPGRGHAAKNAQRTGLYSRVRLVFTGRMAMFTEADYGVRGHITRITVSQCKQVFCEQGFTALECAFHDGPFRPENPSGMSRRHPS